MTSDTGIKENADSRPRIPTPEQVGFRQSGTDVVAGVPLPEDTPYGRMISLSVDKTVDRRTRWEITQPNESRK